jgi:hypothetical protein
VCVGVAVSLSFKQSPRELKVFFLIASTFLPFFLLSKASKLNNDKVFSTMTNQEYFPILYFQINLHNEDQNETRKVIKADFSFDDKPREKLLITQKEILKGS